MVQLTGKVFTEELNKPVVHETMRWLLATKRQGNHSAKTRTEVSGGGKKPWKQKGTGRARAGSNRSPLWRKGGVIFPPKPRDYSFNLPKKVKQLALRVVLSELNRDERIKVLDGLTLGQAKTKAGVKFLKDNGVSGKVLILQSVSDEAFERGVRNIPGVNVKLSKDLNIVDALNADWLLLDKTAVSQLEERLA